MRSLIERDDQLSRCVETEDDAIDRLEIAVDALLVAYMDEHGLGAGDSRLMLAASKISSNLERIADQATNIARCARKLNAEPPLRAVEEMPRMATLTRHLLSEAITAFSERRYELALSIIPQDAVIDELNRSIAKKLTGLMIKSPANITRAVQLMHIAKALERAADHTQNIAEEVFFLCQGRDIRHERHP